jgi:hypothetical protein
MEEDFNDAKGIVCIILTILFLNFGSDYVYPTVVFAIMSILYILIIVCRLVIKLIDLIERNKYIYNNLSNIFITILVLIGIICIFIGIYKFLN